MHKNVYILRYVRSEYAKKIRKAYESGLVKERRCNMRLYEPRADGITNTITTVMKTNRIPGAIRGRYVEEGIQQQLEPRYDQCTNTITSVQKDNVLIEQCTHPISYCIDANYYKGTTVEQFILKKRRQLVLDKNVRVRKLTPKECFRLMGFDDSDFEKARTAMNENIYNGNDRSGSQLYKQAGNSIVVDVLLHITENLYDAMPYLFEDMTVGSFFSGIGAFEKALTRLDTEHESCDSMNHDEVSLKQIGYIDGSNNQSNRVYEPILARTLNAEAGGGGAKTGWYSTITTPKVIIDDTMGFEETARYYEDVCPSLRASRSGLKAVTGIIDPQGRKNKVNTPKDVAPTLRAQIHGNPPCAVYEVSDGRDCEN